MDQEINQKKSVPAPPPPEIAIRTMDSDIKSIEQSGGELIPPQPFTPEITGEEESKTGVELNVPGYTGPEKPVFTPPSVITPEVSLDKKSVNWKIIGIILGILTIILIFGLLGYFVIFPWIFPKQMPPAP